jgi:hypothetical protein
MTDSPPQASPASPQRRTLVLAIGASAAAAGVGLATWRNTHPAAPVAEPFQGFWTQQWTTTDGNMLPMAGFKGKPLLIKESLRQWQPQRLVRLERKRSS